MIDRINRYLLADRRADVALLAAAGLAFYAAGFLGKAWSVFHGGRAYYDIFGAELIYYRVNYFDFGFVRRGLFGTVFHRLAGC